MASPNPYLPLMKRGITTASEGSLSSFPSDSLANRFHGYELYVTGVIAIYFYDLIIHAKKDWSWYLRKKWIAPDLAFFILDKINTLFYCAVILFFLHYAHHTPSTCESTEIISTCFYALGICLQCLELLSILRSYYSDSILLLISLFAYSGATCIFHVSNIFGFGIFTVGSDGNCYLQPGQKPESWIPIAFIMMAIFSLIIFVLIAVKVYSLRCWNELEKMCWRCLFFDDGISYLVLNVTFQTINVVFILVKTNYIDNFVNIAPALIITSICCQRLTVMSASSIVNRYSTSSLLGYSIKKKSIDSSNISTPTLLPQYNEYNRYTIDSISGGISRQSSTSQKHPPQIPQNISSRISQDFTGSLVTIINGFSITDSFMLNDNLLNSLNSLRNSLTSFFGSNQSSVKSHKLLEEGGYTQESNRNYSRAEDVNSSSRVSVISIQNKERDDESYELLSPPQNVYSPEGKGGKLRLSGPRPRAVMPESQIDIYCFWYSNANEDNLKEEDVFLFPPIPPKAQNINEVL